jgi:hypothetical protein
MAVKTIPAQTIKTCDCCGTVMDGRTSRQEGGLTLTAHALDMQGAPCADATRKLDLCDSCLYAVTKAVDHALGSTRAAAQAAAKGEHGNG